MRRPRNRLRNRSVIKKAIDENIDTTVEDKYKINLFNFLLDTLYPNNNKNIFEGDVMLTSYKSSFKSYYKFKVFNDMILNNLFLSGNKKDDFINIFTKVQKYYYIFKKIYYRYIFNKTPINVAIKYDLHFNDLTIYKNKNKIKLIESNVVNTFVVSDLLKIVTVGLINSDNIFSFPLAPKNPYTNIELSYHNLYNLYIHCKEHNFIIPQAFLYYFYSDFNIETLKTNYEPYLREKALKNFHDCLTNASKLEHIRDILRKYKNIIPIEIHRNFPSSTLIEKLEYVIIYYLRIIYSLQPAIVLKNKCKLEKELHIFYKSNKYFGTNFNNNFNNNIIDSIQTPFIFGLSNTVDNNSISSISTSNNNNDTGFEQLVEIANREYNSANEIMSYNSIIANNIFSIINQINENDDISNNTVNNQNNEQDEEQMIINNQIRMREMLAGDGYSDSDNDHDHDDYDDYDDD